MSLSLPVHGQRFPRWFPSWLPSWCPSWFPWGLTLGLALCAASVASCDGAGSPAGGGSQRVPPEHRVLVVGWDGATFDLLDGLAAAGRLPNFSRLRERGTEAWLQSTIVPISSAAWCAATTGKNPGRTGVYSFFEPVPGTYDVQLVSSRSNRATPIWRTLSRRGLASVVWGVPVTYPPEPIDGILVSGMLAPFDSEYAHPRGLAQKLRATGFVPDLGMWRSQAPIKDPAAVEEQVSIKEREVCQALREVDWSLAWIVFKSLDVLSHAEYDGRSDGRVAELCERLDESLGLLCDAAGPNTNVLLVSDHGFRAYAQAFNVHSWLVGAGYAVPRAGARGGRAAGPLADAGKADHHRFLETLDLDETRVFGTKAEGHFGGLRLNVAGREPNGCVPPAEVEALCAELRLGLLALRGPDGRPVVTAVHRARELYPGPYSDRLPDLLFEADDAYQVFSDRNGPLVANLGAVYPDHDRPGIFVAAGPDVARDAAGAAGRLDFAIADVAPTVLALLRLPVYDDLDGRVRSEIFAREIVTRTVAEADDPADSVELLRFLRDDESLDAAERAELMRRMKELGYLE